MGALGINTNSDGREDTISEENGCRCTTEADERAADTGKVYTTTEYVYSIG
jgi:hypothetical protein